MLILNGMSDVKTENRTADKKKARQYYQAEFADSANPFAKVVKRVFFEDHTNDNGAETTWKVGNPEIVKQFLGKTIPGSILNVKVQPYTIGDRTVDNCTIVQLGSESINSAVRATGKRLPEVAEVIVSQEALSMA